MLAALFVITYFEHQGCYLPDGLNWTNQLRFATEKLGVSFREVNHAVVNHENIRQNLWRQKDS